jgi:hypothetical protein
LDDSFGAELARCDLLPPLLKREDDAAGKVGVLVLEGTVGVLVGNDGVLVGNDGELEGNDGVLAGKDGVLLLAGNPAVEVDFDFPPGVSCAGEGFSDRSSKFERVALEALHPM